VAEVGGSQDRAALVRRARLLLQAVPGAQVVILIKVHDDSSIECGRLYAWCVTAGAGGAINQTAPVVFGRTGAGGASRIPWNIGAPVPTVIVPDGVPATPVNLDNILIAFREMDSWLNGAPP